MSAEIKPSSERRCTNVPALVFAIVFIVITIFLVAYCGIAAALRGPRQYQDGCGNICGQLNNNINSTDCGDFDKRNITKLLVGESTYDEETESNDKKLGMCVEECPDGYIDEDNLCREFIDFSIDDRNSTSNTTSTDPETSAASLKATWIYVLIISIIAFVWSYVFLILFRYAAKYVIWIINLSFVVIAFALALWMALEGALPAAIFFGICGLILTLVLCYFKKRIAMVAKLFKETSKALTDIPMLMVEPILTFITLLISFMVFVAFAVIISNAGDDEPLATPAFWCNLTSFIFIVQFIIGCQNFVYASAICRWYFTRDKKKLTKPIKKSFSHLFKFHLGSVCFGAILVTLVKLLKMLLSAVKRSARDSENEFAVILASLLMCLVDYLEKLLVYLVRNAYIIIAKDGTPFIESGKRTVKLLSDHIADVISLNCFGDFVLFVCRLIVVMLSGFVGYYVIKMDPNHEDFIGLAVFLGCIFAFLIAHCFVMVFEMTVDTIFVSFCIDLEENDGELRPFYMSDGLKKVIMEMKEHSGGTLNFGKGIEAGVPMLPMQQTYQQQQYPNMGYGNPNQYTQQSMYQAQPGMPNQSEMPYQPAMPYQDQPSQPKY